MELVEPNLVGMLVALIYTRVSTDDQARDGISLHVQRAACRAYARRHAWPIGSEYEDVISGSRGERAQYEALLTEARRIRQMGQAAVVVVAALDRFGRRLVERVGCREELKALGVPLHSVREGGEVSDLIANVLAAVAQEETRRTAERVSTVARHLIAEGWHLGGNAPWGYRWRPATHAERAMGAPRSVLEVDPDTAPTVRSLFDRVARGETERGAEAWLATLRLEAGDGTTVAPVSVQKTLRRPVYVARPNIGDPIVLRRPAGRWTPLVDDETWERVGERLNNPVLRYASGRYLLTRFLRCHRCGAAAAGHRMDVHHRDTYFCRGTACRAFIGGTAPLDAAVLSGVRDTVRPIISGTSHQRAVFRRAWEELRQPAMDPETKQRTADLAGGIDRAQRRLIAADMLRRSGDLDPIGYAAVRQKVQADLDEAQAALANLRDQVAQHRLPSIDRLRRDARDWWNVLGGDDVLAKRRILAILIDRVERLYVGRGRYWATITWTPLGEAARTAGRAEHDDPHS